MVHTFLNVRRRHYGTDSSRERPHDSGATVLAIIDEMAQFGPHMKSLENAMGMAAGAAGLQLLYVLQNLSQLRDMFPQTWENFIENCGVTTWFGARDETNADQLGHSLDVNQNVYTQTAVSTRQLAVNQLEETLNGVQMVCTVPASSVIQRFYWSGRPGSNRRHSAWEADVLPLNYSRNLFICNELQNLRDL
jgi:hypothetical protein